MYTKTVTFLMFSASLLVAQEARKLNLAGPLPYADSYEWGISEGPFQAAAGFAPGFARWQEHLLEDDPSLKPIPLVAKYHQPIFLTLALRNTSSQSIKISYDMSEPQGSCRIINKDGSVLPSLGVRAMNGWMTNATIPAGHTHFSLLLLGPMEGVANRVLVEDPPPGEYTAHCEWTPIECIGTSTKRLDRCASTKQLPRVEAPPFQFTVTREVTRPDKAADGLQSFTDTTGAVSFSYSAKWKRVPRFQSYSPSAAFAASDTDGLKPEMILEFDDPHFAHSELETLAFQFGHFQTSSATTCHEFADAHTLGDIDDRKASYRNINGVRFRHSTNNGAASAGHDIEAKVYTTFQNRECFVFEGDLATEHVMDDVHELSSKDYEELWHQAEAIVQSIKFSR